MKGHLDRHWVARQGKDGRRAGPEGKGFSGTLCHAVKGRGSEKRFDDRANEIVFSL